MGGREPSVWALSCCFPGCISRQLACKQSQDLNPGIPKWIKGVSPKCHPPLPLHVLSCSLPFLLCPSSLLPFSASPSCIFYCIYPSCHVSIYSGDRQGPLHYLASTVAGTLDPVWEGERPNHIRTLNLKAIWSNVCGSGQVFGPELEEWNFCSLKWSTFVYLHTYMYF